jgi:hypothetical protein
MILDLQVERGQVRDQGQDLQVVRPAGVVDFLVDLQVAPQVDLQVHLKQQELQQLDHQWILTLVRIRLDLSLSIGFVNW